MEEGEAGGGENGNSGGCSVPQCISKERTGSPWQLKCCPSRSGVNEGRGFKVGPLERDAWGKASDGGVGRDSGRRECSRSDLTVKGLAWHPSCNCLGLRSQYTLQPGFPNGPVGLTSGRNVRGGANMTTRENRIVEYRIHKRWKFHGHLRALLYRCKHGWRIGSARHIDMWASTLGTSR